MTVSRRTSVYQKFWLSRCPADIFTLFRFHLSEPHFQRFYFFTSIDLELIQSFNDILSAVMEYHSVPLEERARDEDGNLLPWGYVYKEYV